jgi:hypothetical protein
MWSSAEVSTSSSFRGSRGRTGRVHHGIGVARLHDAGHPPLVLPRAHSAGEPRGLVGSGSASRVQARSRLDPSHTSSAARQDSVGRRRRAVARLPDVRGFGVRRPAPDFPNGVRRRRWKREALHHFTTGSSQMQWSDADDPLLSVTSLISRVEGKVNETNFGLSPAFMGSLL